MLTSEYEAMRHRMRESAAPITDRTLCDEAYRLGMLAAAGICRSQERHFRTLHEDDGMGDGAAQCTLIIERAAGGNNG